MNIVGSTYFLRNLRNLDFFTLDFGKAKKDEKTHTFRKVDEFIVKYRSLYARQIMKFGKIGNKITFYEDLAMENNEYAIFKDDDIYEITFEPAQIEDMENYILETLRKIDEAESEEKEMINHNEQRIRENISNEEGWIAKDDRNYCKTYSINQTLSKEEYRKAFLSKIKGTKSIE
jgi:hypothetical protein